MPGALDDAIIGRSDEQVDEGMRGAVRMMILPVEGIGSGGDSNKVRVRMPGEDALTADLALAEVFGAMPAIGDNVLTLIDATTRRVVTGGSGGGGGSGTLESFDFEGGTFPAGWTQHRSPVDANAELAVLTAAAIEGTYGMRVRDGLTASDPDLFIDKGYPVATYGSEISLQTLLRLTTVPTQASVYSQVLGITSLDVDQADPVGLVMYRGASGSASLFAYRWHMSQWFEHLIVNAPANGTVLDVELKVSGLKTNNGSIEVWIGQGGAARTLRWRHGGIDFTNAIFDSTVPWVGSQSGLGYPAATSTYDYDSVDITIGRGNPLGAGAPVRNFVRMGADVAITAAAWTSITGLSFPVAAGKIYHFDARIRYDASSATAGSAWALTGPAFTELGYISQWSDNINGIAFDSQAAYDATSPTTSGASITGNYAYIQGSIKPSADGTVIMRGFGEATFTTTAQAGSTLEYWEG